MIHLTPYGQWMQGLRPLSSLDDVWKELAVRDVCDGLIRFAGAIFVAATLCEAFRLGRLEENRVWVDDFSEGWKPGCGRPAPNIFRRK